MEEWLAQGFTGPKDWFKNLNLKEQYEDENLDYSFSKREIIIITREDGFPNLDEALKNYLDLVAQLDDLDKEQANYYRKHLV